MHPTSTRRRIAALAVAAATALPVLMVVPESGAQTVGELRFSENYRQGDDPAASRGRDVPGLAVNPADPRHVVSVSVDYLNGECSFKTSLDGGVTWPFAGNFEAPPGWPDPPCFQNFDSGGYAHGNASVVFGSGQNVYTAFSSHRGPFQRPESRIIAGIGDDSLVARSTDGGRTWHTAVPAILGGPDAQPFYIRPQVAVHRGAGNGGADRVYVNAWACRVITPGCSGGNDIRQMWVSRSDDGGQTWTPRVRATGPEPAATQGEQVNEPSQPVVDPRNGNVYMAWRRRDTATTPRVNNVTIARSTDLGQTWERFTAGPAAGGAHPRLAIDPGNGTLYLAYQDNPFASDQDVVLVKSTDAGTTWSAPLRVNDDAVGNGASQQVPRVEVAPNGRVDVVWLDRRHDPTSPVSRGRGDIYYAYSLDGGDNFSANRRVTDRHFNRDVGLTGVGGYTWYGPVVAAMGNEEALVAWTDSREGNFNNGRQDIYLSRLDLTSDSLPVKRLPEADLPGLSVTLSQLAYPGGLEGVGATPIAASKVVVVNENDPVAALAAAPLARANWGPLLASPAPRLTPGLIAEAARMEAIGAFVVGDEAALGAGVVNALNEANVPAAEIERLAGSSPADLARKIALAMDPRDAEEKAENEMAFDLVVVVNPAAPESAAAAGLASALGVPILFTDRDSVPAATREAMAALGNIDATLVIGGTGAVSDAVVASLPGAERVAGGDTASLSRAVMAEAVDRGMPTNIVYVADSARPMDAALVGATGVGRNGGLMLLVPGADPAAAEQVLAAANLRSTTDRLVVARSVAHQAGPGYRLVASDGGIFAFGGAGFFGSTGAMRLAQPMVGLAATPSDRGYWTTAADGGVFAFGDAQFRGSTGAIRLAQPVVGMAATPSGNGYWLVARDGGVFAFGDAVFHGSTGAIHLNQPIVGMAATPSGNGYWLVASDGGVFAFGDAGFRGSTGAIRLNQPMVGMAASPSGLGYLLVARDGGVFAFGDAAFHGSTGAIRLNQPMVGMDATPSGRGYWLVASDGGVFAFGDAVFHGSTGAIRLNRPVVGMAAGG